MIIYEKLDLLSAYQDQVVALSTDKQKLIESVLPDEIKQKIADIEVEFSGKLETLNKNISELETEIKFDVLSIGNTVKGEHLMAVWNKGRITWDSRGLDGYLVAHPEISAFRKENEPTVTIRRIK